MEREYPSHEGGNQEAPASSYQDRKGRRMQLVQWYARGLLNREMASMASWTAFSAKMNWTGEFSNGVQLMRDILSSHTDGHSEEMIGKGVEIYNKAKPVVKGVIFSKTVRGEPVTLSFGKRRITL